MLYAAVFRWYQAGAKVERRPPALVGQLLTERQKDVTKLVLRRLDWVQYSENFGGKAEVQAALWRPELCAIAGENLVVRGLERVDGRWYMQRWQCELLGSRERALNYGKLGPVGAVQL